MSNSYRPITDLWILGRPKVAYYGAYPSGFVGRARDLLGVGPLDAVLHVCGGKVREYPFKGVGVNDQTVDIRPELKPDHVLDVTKDPLPDGFAAHLIDPPYTPADARQYSDYAPFPAATPLMAKCLTTLPVGCRAGMLHYEWPGCPDFAREVAVIAVTTGRKQRARLYTVMEVVR